MVKRIAGCIREFKVYAILAPIFVALECFLEVLIPYLMSKLLDKGINVPGGDMSQILKYGLIIAGCAIVSLICGACCGVTSSRASVGFARNLRHDMYHKVQEYSFSNIDKFSTASIVTRLTSDVSNVQMAFMTIIRVMVRSPLMMIFALFFCFRINHKITWVFLAAVPVLAIGLFLLMSKAHPIFERVFRKYDKLNEVVEEDLRGIRVVKAFVREDYERDKFKAASADIYNEFVTAERILSFNRPLMSFCMYACQLLVYWLGAQIIVNSGGTEMTVGTLSSFMSYATQLLMSLMMLSQVFVMITMARASAERVCEILTEESDIQNPATPVTEVKDGSVRFKNVSFGYGRTGDGRQCLSDINLEIESGQTIGIIGGTGSSKSSLVQLIPRLYDVTGGSVEVGGVDVRDYDITTLRNSVAMVLQKNVLFSGTLKENLRWGKEDATDEEIIHACRLAQADGFISEMPDGYDTYIEQGGSNVSGGQKQRICIARALLKKPKILILDDSTSAVDTATDASIRRAFREEIPNTTKFIIAQRIASVQDADKIIVLENGRIDGFGTHDELMENNEIYREVYMSQQKGGGDFDGEQG
ncbi:MAG: ABC transporter ATP-binding protein [Clostridiales bacterium]|nr:ABC transporter ATP-binding protein [Clostridiales bacterium]